jgi:hypothetical protein
MNGLIQALEEISVLPINISLEIGLILLAKLFALFWGIRKKTSSITLGVEVESIQLLVFF